MSGGNFIPQHLAAEPAKVSSASTRHLIAPSLLGNRGATGGAVLGGAFEEFVRFRGLLLSR